MENNLEQNRDPVVNDEIYIDDYQDCVGDYSSDIFVGISGGNYGDDDDDLDALSNLNQLLDGLEGFNGL